MRVEGCCQQGLRWLQGNNGGCVDGSPSAIYDDETIKEITEAMVGVFSWSKLQLVLAIGPNSDM